MTKALEKFNTFIKKEQFKVYLKPGQKVPEGKQVQTTERGKRFYYAESTGKKHADTYVGTHEIETEARRDKEKEKEFGLREDPWHIKQGVKVEEIGDHLTRYTKGDHTIDVTSTATGFSVRDNGKVIGTSPREKDTVLYVQRRLQ